MKKTIFTILAIAAAFIAAIGCSKFEPQALPQSDEILVGDDSVADGDFAVTFHCTLADESAEPQTKTAFHDNTIWWSKGDKVGFYQKATVGGVAKLAPAALTLSKDFDSFSAKVTSFSTPDEGTEAAYYSVYPYASYVTNGTASGVNYPILTLPSTQSPTVSSFDPAADILISKYVIDSKRDTSFKMEYTRPSAIAKMTIKNLPTSENIKSIAFSAIKSGEAVNLAGTHWYDLINGEISSKTSSSCKDQSEITLDYSGKNITADSATGMTAYFCCYPFELAAGDSFQVVVTTEDDITYTKEVILPKALPFEASRGTRFSVDMSSNITVSWFDVIKRSHADFTNGAAQLYYSFTSKSITISELYYRLVSAEDYLAAIASGTVGSLYEDESSFNKLGNSGLVSLVASSKANISVGVGFVEPDADYYVLVKISDSSKGYLQLAYKLHTDAFGFSMSALVAAGKVGHKLYGKNVSSIKYIVVLSSEVGELSNTTCRQYYEANASSAESVSSTRIEIMNTKGSEGYGYFASGEGFESGAECVEMVLATMTDGSTKFCWLTTTAQ